MNRPASIRSSATPSRPAHLRALRLGQSVVHQDDAFVPSTTSLFRGEAQLLEAARVGLLAASVRNETPRALCIGVSSGEEAYSLLAAFDSLGAVHATVLGIDCVPERIAEAVRAEFDAPSAFPTWVASDAFLQLAPSRVTPAERLRARAAFLVGDLVQRDEAIVWPRAHVVLCRNVLTYFTPEARRQAARALASWVWPEGRVFLGAAERLLPEGQGLSVVQSGEFIAYRDSNFG